MGVSPQIVDPGGTVTFTMVGENGDNVTRAAERGVLGWSVGYGTNVVSGCTRFDDSCTIRLGTAGGPRPRYWNWNLVQGSTPSYWFCGPSEYYPVVCDRCYGLLGTNAWGYYAVRPSDSNKPTASFTVANMPGFAKSMFRFTSTTQPVNGFTPSLVWNFGDGQTQQGGNFLNHTYARAGTYTTTLTASVGGDSDTATRLITVQGAGLESSLKIIELLDGVVHGPGEVQRVVQGHDAADVSARWCHFGFVRAG